MPSQRGLEADLHEVAQLAGHEPTRQAEESLRRFLQSRNNLLAARAVDVVREWSSSEFVPELLELWEGAFVDPVKNDRACHLKLAVVEALHALDYEDTSPFLRGARHVQLEPAYGPPVDSAAQLRTTCAQILASMGYSEIYLLLADLLMDPDPGVRAAAAELAAELGGERGELLLRIRVQTAEDHTENYAAYFRGLLQLAPDRSLPLVESYAGGESPGVAEEAILALGESRLEEAFPILRGLYDATIIAESRRVVVLAIGLLRIPETVDFLEEVVRDHDARSAEHAIEAFGFYRGSSEVLERGRTAVEQRGDPRLLRLFITAVEE